MTATFLLIRHGATGDLDVRLSGRRPGVPLSPAGEAQAAAAAQFLVDEPVDLILASPLERTRATAEAVARVVGRPVATEEALLELDVGEWTGTDFPTLAADPRWTHWNEERATACCPGGETMAAAQARITGLIRRLATERDGQLIALVTHSDLIRGALCDVLGLGLAGVHRFDIDPASITRIVVGDWGGRVLSMNLVAGKS